MSQYVLGLAKSFKAEADYSAKQYLLVKLGATAGGCLLSTANTDLIIGAIQNKPASGEGADIPLTGTALVKAGGTLSKGAYLTADSASKAISEGTEDKQIFGIALEDAVVDDVFEYLPIPLGVRP